MTVAAGVLMPPKSTTKKKPENLTPEQRLELELERHLDAAVKDLVLKGEIKPPQRSEIYDQAFRQLVKVHRQEEKERRKEFGDLHPLVFVYKRPPVDLLTEQPLPTVKGDKTSPATGNRARTGTVRGGGDV